MSRFEIENKLHEIKPVLPNFMLVRLVTLVRMQMDSKQIIVM